MGSTDATSKTRCSPMRAARLEALSRLACATAMALCSASAFAAPQECPTADLDGNGLVDEADIEIVRRQLGRTCPPRIDAITPSVGALGEASTITIEGLALGGATSVTIGGVAAASIEAIAPQSLRVVVAPSSEPGPKEILVTTPTGTASLPAGFRHLDANLAWAETIETAPDPEVVVDPALRSAIEATGLPWRVRDKTTGIELLLVPPGSFAMGSPSDDPNAFPDESPVRTVAITRPFYLGRTEVTRGQWNPQATAPDVATDLDQHPIEGVSWIEAMAFATRHGLRLPTEAEWEYACRAGGEGPSREELSAFAWHWPISGGSSQPVATRLANGFGLHDMLGNAFEWVADWYGPYDATDLVDPQGSEDGTGRVVRGGSWYFRTLSRPARRYEFEPQQQRHDVGFRVARDP